jgi:hypothetical protein
MFYLRLPVSGRTGMVWWFEVIFWLVYACVTMSWWSDFDLSRIQFGD